MSTCKDPDYHKKYYRAHREQLIAAEKARYRRKREDPTFKLEAKARREHFHFGCSREEIFAKTGGKCFLCDNAATVVHHMDRDGRNLEKIGVEPGKDQSRLVGLCRACHINEHRGDLMEAKRNKSRPWGKSRDGRVFDACTECGTSTKDHGGKGLCVTCAPRVLRKSRACSL